MFKPSYVIMIRFQLTKLLPPDNMGANDATLNAVETYFFEDFKAFVEPEVRVLLDELQERKTIDSVVNERVSLA